MGVHVFSAAARLAFPSRLAWNCPRVDPSSWDNARSALPAVKGHASARDGRCQPWLLVLRVPRGAAPQPLPQDAVEMSASVPLRIVLDFFNRNALTKNPTLLAWVDEMARLTKPDRIVWCDGSEDEKRSASPRRRSREGILEPLNQEKLPGLLPAPLEPERRRARRAPDVHLHADEGRGRARPTTGWRPTRPTRSSASSSTAR